MQILLWGWAAVTAPLAAAPLPENKAEFNYHVYSGDHVQVHGPAVLVRKTLGHSVSIGAGYRADTISSASIDVVTTASPYDEFRQEVTLDSQFRYADALIGLNYTLGDESDYRAESAGIDISQDVFGNMTTVTLGYTRAWDQTRRRDTDFSADIDRHRFRIGVAQILTRRSRLHVDYEAIVDDGFLANPYRSARLLGATVPERFPDARTSNALAVRSLVTLRPRTALRVGYRYFWDTWRLRSHTLETAWRVRFGQHRESELRARYYVQRGASFYRDNFEQELNFMTRDKELSDFSSFSVGFEFGVDLGAPSTVPWIDQRQIEFSYDYIRFDYKNFTDIRNNTLFTFGSHLAQILFALRF